MNIGHSLVLSALIFTTATFSQAASAQFAEISPGVEYWARTDPGPNRIRALRIDLCEPGIRIKATRSEDRGQRTSAWASSQGALAAVNGGYFLNPGFYPDAGVAAGGGVLWPDAVNGVPRGYFGFAQNRMEHFPVGDTAAIAPWLEESVNGDATHVLNGGAVDCGGCGFNTRAPRTALGYTADQKLLMVVVDGRSPSSRGMTIDELAVLMQGLGADRAMNLDGGGSSAMYLQGQGLVNVPSDGSERTVANHLGIFREDTPLAYNCPDRLPRGFLDQAGCSSVTGWAQDLDVPDAPIDAHMYIGGPAGSGAYGAATSANRRREDLCSAIGSCDHGFSFTSPLSFHDGVARPVHLYAINEGPLGNVELGNSPMMMQCELPTPPYDSQTHVKRRISDEGFAAWAFDRVNVAPRGIAPAYDSAPLWPETLRLVKSADNNTVYLVDGDVLRAFSSTAQLARWSGSLDAVEVLDLEAFRFGPPMLDTPFLMDGANGTFVIDVFIEADEPADAGLTPDAAPDAGTNVDAGDTNADAGIVNADVALGADASFPDVEAMTDGGVDANPDFVGTDVDAALEEADRCQHLGIGRGTLWPILLCFCLPLILLGRRVRA